MRLLIVCSLSTTGCCLSTSRLLFPRWHARTPWSWTCDQGLHHVHLPYPQQQQQQQQHQQYQITITITKQVRRDHGRQLAREHPVPQVPDGDPVPVVVPVPVSISSHKSFIVTSYRTFWALNFEIFFLCVRIQRHTQPSVLSRKTFAWGARVFRTSVSFATRMWDVLSSPRPRSTVILR